MSSPRSSPVQGTSGSIKSILSRSSSSKSLQLMFQAEEEEAGSSNTETSQEQEQGWFPVTSKHPAGDISTVHTFEEMDQTEESLTQSEAEIEEADDSPLDQVVPKISSETLQPLVLSFCNKLGSLNLKERDSRKVLAQMFLEVIESLANLILEAFRNMVMQGRATQRPLQVSEKAVKRAMHRGLRESFKEAAGSSDQTTKGLLNLLSAEVTGQINASLGSSEIKGERILLPENSYYRPRKEKIKALMCYARDMLRFVQDNVTTCCSGQASPEDEPSQAENQEQPLLASPSSTAVRSVQDRVPSFLDEQDEALMEMISPSPVHINSSGERSTTKPCEETQSEEKPRCANLRTLVSKLCPLSCACCKDTDTVSVDFSEGAGRSSSPVREATTEVREILLQEAVELSKEDRASLSEHSLDTASAIVHHIMEEISLQKAVSTDSLHSKEQSNVSYSQSTSFLTSVSQKVKAFFTMCFAKGTLRKLLTPLCSNAHAKPNVSMEEVMGQTSPLLQQLIQEDGDVYVTLHKTIALRQHVDLSEELTGVISDSMAIAKHRPAFRKDVRTQVKMFLVTMSDWIHHQTRLPVLRDPVQRVLGRIRRMVFRMSQPSQSSQRLMLPSTDERLVLQRQSEERLVLQRQSDEPVFTETQIQAPTFTPQVSTSTQRHEPVMFRELTPQPVHSASEQTPPQFPGALPVSQGPSSLWSDRDCNALIYEVVSRIFRTRRPYSHEMLTLSQNLQQQLPQQVCDWNVRVKPSQRSYQDVADAVYRDLCKDFKSRYVAHSALTDSSFSATILKSICFNLEMPQKKRTVCSYLRSAWDAICRRF